MAPCLCAPTTHEGSFRCRLHRGLPLAQLASTFHKGASVSCSAEITPHKPCLASVRESPSATSTPPLHQATCGLHIASSTSSAVSATPPAPSSSSLPSFRHARPPTARRAASLPVSSCRSPYPGSLPNSSPTWTTTAPSSCKSPSTSHAAALAIMKQHLSNKNSRGHMNRSNTVPRSAGGYKIGPSRLSRMARACTDDVPVLKKMDYSIPNIHPHDTFPLKITSSNSVEPQAKLSTSMEASRINLKMQSVVAKFKQSESSCKLVGYKAGPFIVSTVY